MKYSLLVFLLLALALTEAASKGEAFPERHDVGFRSFVAYDTSRPAVREQGNNATGRALQINVWYPATGGTSKRMNFNDYVDLAGAEIGYEVAEPGQIRTEYYQWTQNGKNPSPAFRKFKQVGISMEATREATPNGKVFPLVLLIHGGAADFAFLGEYLASHGYLAVNVPYKGYRQAQLDVNLLGMSTQVRDFEFAISQIKKSMSFDPTSISAIAVSFGGQSAVSLSFRKGLKCIVSLDGGIGSKFGSSLLRQDTLYTLQNINTPLLHIYNPRDPYTDISAIREYKFCERTLIGMKNMEHAHFWSWGKLDRFVPGIVGEVHPGKSYDAVFQETLNFLSKHNMNDDSTCQWCLEYEDSHEVLSSDG